MVASLDPDPGAKVIKRLFLSLTAGQDERALGSRSSLAEK